MSFANCNIALSTLFLLSVLRSEGVAQEKVPSCLPAFALMSISSPPSIGIGGLACVSEQSATQYICPNDRRKISNLKISDQIKMNVFNGGRSVISEMAACYRVEIHGYAADHRGTYPNYLCSAMVWQVIINWNECRNQQ